MKELKTFKTISLINLPSSQFNVLFTDLFTDQCNKNKCTSELYTQFTYLQINV